MPRHQPGKRFVRVVFHIALQQRAVIRWLHSWISVRRPVKADNLFATFPGATQRRQIAGNAMIYSFRSAEHCSARINGCAGGAMLRAPSRRNSAKLPVDF
jgi:hypothetical protein